VGQERTEFFCASDELRNGEESRQFEGSDFLGGVLNAGVPKPEHGTGMIVDDDMIRYLRKCIDCMKLAKCISSKHEQKNCDANLSLKQNKELINRYRGYLRI
jgi:hypothetical protein